MKYLFTICSIFIFLMVTPVESSTPRIRQLIPDEWLYLPCIEPAIPSDYVASKPDRSFNYGMSILWGKEADFAKFMNDQIEAINSPLFRVQYSLNVAQTGPDSFSGEEDLKKELSNAKFKEFSIDKFKWGEYPVQAIRGVDPKGKPFYMTWIGLNSETMVLMIHLIPSHDKAESDKVWDTFITKTKYLSEPACFIARGMDMQDGYTNYSSGTAQLKVYAEKRDSDGKLAIKVVPVSPNTTFAFSNIYEARMGSTWKYNEPCVKVSGIITEKSDKFGTNIIDSVITILTKPVKEFSFPTDESEESTTILHQDEKSVVILQGKL